MVTIKGEATIKSVVTIKGVITIGLWSPIGTLVVSDLKSVVTVNHVIATSDVVTTGYHLIVITIRGGFVVTIGLWSI